MCACTGLMYEDVLIKRREAMRDLDLATNEKHLKEWLALIAELDAVMRLSNGYVQMVRTVGHSSQAVHAEAGRSQVKGNTRPRSNSVLMSTTAPSVLACLPTEARGTVADAPGHLRRPRAQSFTTVESGTVSTEDEEHPGYISFLPHTLTRAYITSNFLLFCMHGVNFFVHCVLLPTYPHRSSGYSQNATFAAVIQHSVYIKLQQ